MSKPNYSSISIIYNPIATGPAPQSAKSLHKKISDILSDIPVKLVETKYKYHAIELGENLAKEPDALIIYTGGDGGYHELINGVMKLPLNNRPIVAVNPAGNANDHHRTVIGKGKDLSELILQNKIKSIDLLAINIDHPKQKNVIYAHSYLGIGATGRVAKSLDQDRQGGKRFVRVRQVNTIIQELLSHDAFLVETADGTKVKLKNMIATNAPEMAMVLKVSKEAKLDDNQFELVVTPAGSRKLFLKQVAKAMVKGLAPKRAYKEYSFKLLENADAQVDGEVYHFTKNSVITLKSQSKAIRTLV